MAIIKYDFETTLQKLKDYIKIKDSWKDAYLSSIGTVMLEIVAAAVENLGYYMERRVQELYLDTAKIPSSIRHLAALLGYSPRRKRSSIGTARITFDTALTSALTLSKGYSFTVDNIIYSLLADIVIPSGSSTYDVEVYQGELIQISYDLTDLGNLSPYVNFFSDGRIKSLKVADLGDLLPDYDTISDNYFKVYVLKTGNVSVEYTLSEKTLNSLTLESKVYLMKYYFNKMKIHFSNGITGFNPTDEDDNPIILIEYFKCDGLTGNISAQIDNLTFTDDIGLTGYTLSLLSSSGGEAEEEADSIAINAPRLFSTGNRAISLADYIYFLTQYSSLIVISNAWGEQEEIDNGIDSSGCRNKARYTVLAANFVNYNNTYTGEVVGTGDGAILIFSDIVLNLPIIPGSLDLTWTVAATPVTVTDDGVGGIAGAGISSGTINYTTGAIDITFSTAPDNATDITIDYTDSVMTDTIDTWLRDYQGISVQPEYIDPFVAGYVHTLDLNLQIAVLPGFSFSNVSTLVETAISTNFGDSFFSFGETIYKSDIIKIITETAGVDGVVLDWDLDNILYTEEIWNPYAAALAYERPFSNIAKIGAVTISAL